MGGIYFTDLETAALRRARRLWPIFALLALLLHAAAVLLVHVDWSGTPQPAPVEVREIDPKKLDAIRKQWDNQAKTLLINPDKNKPKEETAPPKDARYFSDRNQHVERETRARDTAILPKFGAPGEPGAETARQAPSHSTPLPALGNLGLPLRLDKPAPKVAQKPEVKPRQQAQGRGGESGGQQYVREKELPSAGETMLNAQESVFYSFYARLYEAIAPNWQSRVNNAQPERPVQPGNEYLTVLEIALDSEGKLVELKIIQGSGIQAYDQALIDAWKKVGQLPNPPKAILDKDGLVRIKNYFTVIIHGGIGFHALPPERVY